jgi:HKD family nuclease
LDLTTFLHNDTTAPTTVSEIKRIHGQVATQNFLGIYAYATQSGVASFDLELGGDFWQATPSRWLFGIDYGRTQPQALRFMCSKGNADIRIHDGSWVVNQNGFVPRRDFHAKLAIMLNAEANLSGMVVGSGNFSSNGLRKSIEAGAAICTQSSSEFDAILRPSLELAEFLWEQATPVVDILDVYEEKWSASFSRRVAENQPNDGVDYGEREIFWIEAGYVTKNRGPNRPGNQIDFPKGMARYFGFNPPDNLLANSIIGEITFETPIGAPVSNNLRLGNNMMEKISLPIPETHGFDIYDGKILVFQRSGDRYVMRALEADDFETAFGDRLLDVRVMNSGRRYGHIL